MEKCGYGKCDHQYNVSCIQLHALLGVRNKKWSAIAESVRNTALQQHLLIAFCMSFQAHILMNLSLLK
jgi:hypothetical protein